MATLDATGPEWQKIAGASQIPTQELAQLFVQAILMMAV